MGRKKQDTSRNNHAQNLSAKPSKLKPKKKNPDEWKPFGNHGSGYIALVFLLGK
jgi:hypothetical protein